jgi:phage terminase large subunit
MTTIDIANKWKDIGIDRELVYFDSAEPRLIEELRRMGFNIRPSLKGADSVNAGIDFLKRFKIHIQKIAIIVFKNLETTNGKKIELAKQ